jgi:hypothetical protein
MSARQIIEELPRLTSAELREIERRASELIHPPGTSLRAEQIGGRLVLVGPRVILQSEVDAILEELP